MKLRTRKIIWGSSTLFWIVIMIISVLYGKPLHMRITHPDLDQRLTALELRAEQSAREEYREYITNS